MGKAQGFRGVALADLLSVGFDAAEMSCGDVLESALLLTSARLGQNSANYDDQTLRGKLLSGPRVCGGATLVTFPSCERVLTSTPRGMKLQNKMCGAGHAALRKLLVACSSVCVMLFWFLRPPLASSELLGNADGRGGPRHGTLMRILRHLSV